MEEENVAAEGNGPVQARRHASAMPNPGSSWVVNMQEMIDGIGAGSGAAPGSAERPAASIYRVPEYIKKLTNPDAYRPQLVSLGPFHHGDPALLPMESHKRRAVAHMVKRSGKPLKDFVAAVEEIKTQLEDAYEDLDDKWRHGPSFVELMLTDGCFLLETGRIFMEGAGSVDGDYKPDDLVFSEHGRLYLFSTIRSDVVLMENQLPLLLLQKLTGVAYPDKFEDDGAINNWVIDLLGDSVTCVAYLPTFRNDRLGLHPLDVLQTSLFYSLGRWPEIRPYSAIEPASAAASATEFAMPCAAELHEAGIHFKLSGVEVFTRGISFEDSVLTIPQILLYDNVESTFLNLMAFERLHPAAGNVVISFVFFMDLLIDTAKDVTILRSKEIIKNGLGSDKVVADLFSKTLMKGAIISKDSSLSNVIRKVNAHYKKSWNKWRASFIHTYFINPWVFISLVAAVILLIATVMQTVYTIVPFYKN